MLIFFFLSFSFCEVFEWRNSNNKKTLVFDVTGDQICKGHFKPLPGSNSSFKVIIRSEKNSIFFQNDNLPMNVETHYSFNVTDNEDLICEMTPVDVEKQRGFQSELEIRFETQFDTFRKEVAKEVRVEPAMYSLNKLEIYFMNIQTNEDLLC
ncbi:putative membrane integral protein, partial [Nosema bombycis CQ1]